ncbi:hypothetical protein A5N86_17225 [Geobacillus thermoleovorans]|nr:hypothetical protein A5N86_17225 [Geobacillus thermoleovorans]
MDVKEFVKEKLILKEIKESEGNARFNVKLSINIDEVMNRRFTYVAQQLGMKRAELFRELALEALAAVEKELGLDPYDLDSSYAQLLYEGLDEINVYDVNGRPIPLSREQYFEVLRGRKEGDQ